MNCELSTDFRPIVEQENSLAPFFSYVKEGETLVDILNPTNPIPLVSRTDVLLYKDKRERKPRIKKVTEKEAIIDLVQRLKSCYDAAKILGKEDSIEAIEALSQLTITGEPELREATTYMSQDLAATLRSGQHVILQLTDMRSDRYITHLVLEQLLQEPGNEALLSQITMSNDFNKVATKYQELSAQGIPTQVRLYDDHVLSGMQMRKFMSDMFEAMLAQGVPLEEIQQQVQAHLIAAPKPAENLAVEYSTLVGRTPFKVKAYYGVEGVQRGNSSFGYITATHCPGDVSTSFPFQDVSKEFHKALGGNPVTPILFMLQKPYETKKDGRYKNPALQASWEQIIQHVQIIA